MVDIPSWLSIILLVFFFLMSAFYNATETAFARLNKFKFQVEKEDGRKSSALIVFLYDHFDTTLITVLIGTNVFSVLISTVSTFLFYRLFQGVLDDSASSLIASLSMAVLAFLFSDTLPKLLAKRAPDAIARINAYPMMFFVILFYPVSALFRFLEWALRKIFKTKEDPEITQDDIAEEVEKMEKVGDLEENESDLIVASIDFADTSVREVLTPRRKIAAFNLEGAKNEDVIAFLKECPFSRIPVYYKDLDHVAGILVVKKFLSAYFRDHGASFLQYVQKPYFVTPSIKMDDLLDGFREHHVQMAIVRSKDNKTIGMVTMEDVLEELVGDIDESPISLGGEK